MKTDRRIVVEHPDGRRVSCLESEFSQERANPYNRARTVVEHDNDAGTQTIRQLPPRPMDDHVSLEAEGFTPVAYIHGETCDERCAHSEKFVLHAADEQCVEEVVVGPRVFTLAKTDHREHLEDPDTAVIYPGHEFAIEGEPHA